jgi:hypothetical protein
LPSSDGKIRVRFPEHRVEVMAVVRIGLRKAVERRRGLGEFLLLEQRRDSRERPHLSAGHLYRDRLLGAPRRLLGASRRLAAPAVASNQNRLVHGRPQALRGRVCAPPGAIGKQMGLEPQRAGTFHVQYEACADGRGKLKTGNRIPETGNPSTADRRLSGSKFPVSGFRSFMSFPVIRRSSPPARRWRVAIRDRRSARC